MTMRYAAITQETIVKDYHAALKKSEQTYETAIQSSSPTETSPKQMLADTIRWLRKNHTATPTQKRRADAIIKRIYATDQTPGTILYIIDHSTPWE